MTIDGAKRYLDQNKNKDKILISIRNKLEKVKSRVVVSEKQLITIFSEIDI